MTTIIRRRPRRLDVYTDGACSGGRGDGGWAWSLADKSMYRSGSEKSTTNQRMEMWAAYDAIKTLSVMGKKITVVSDSAYVINCFEQRWYRNWREGVKVKDKSPVANWDIWTLLIPAVLECDVRFRKVKGHSGDPLNDFVDMLAVKAKRGTLVP